MPPSSCSPGMNHILRVPGQMAQHAVIPHVLIRVISSSQEHPGLGAVVLHAIVWELGPSSFFPCCGVYFVVV